MGQVTVSVESGNSDSDNENADIESEEVSEEEEPSEEPVEEDPDEDEEAQEVDSCEEPNEENLCKQELDEVASCEVDPKEDDTSGEDSVEHVLQEDEHDEVDSCGSPSKEACPEEPNEESCEEEPYEEDEQLEEETQKEPCEEVQDVDEFCEEPEEPSEEELEEEPIEEEEDDDEEPFVKELEKGPGEEEPDPDEEQNEDPEEDPSEDNLSGGSPVNRSCSRNNDELSRPYSEKMNMPFDTMHDPKRIPELSAIQNPSDNKIVLEKLATAGNAGRKRRSRWDRVDEVKELTKASGSTNAEKGTTQGSGGSKKRKRKRKKKKTRHNNNSQISTESLLENPTIASAQEILQMEEQLLQISNKLQSGIADDRAESERSPSPPPVYNNLGIRINTREVRLRSKLKIQRKTIISELMCKNPNFKPPPDHKRTNYQKMIYVPTKENPGYNFIGIILGPRGRTLRGMERETGAQIQLRGKCYGNDGTVWNDRPNLTDDEVYVMIVADNRRSFDAAVAMVEKLLVPVKDGHNEVKLAQLRELAKLNGALRGNNTNNYGKPGPCAVCGNAAHPTSACPLTAPASGTSSNSHQVNFFAEMGGVLPSFAGPMLPVPIPPTGANAAAPVNKPQKEIDEANLFIGQLPQSVADTKLMELFSCFGPIVKAHVIRDKSTGSSKGYGFVKYTDRAYAAKAVAQMNGYKIEGRNLVVHIAGILQPPVNQRPTYPMPPSIPHQITPYPMHWPGPPELRLPETVAPFLNTSHLAVHDSPFSGQYSASLAPSFQTPMAPSLFSGDFVMSNELARFPGYLKSLDPPSQLYHLSAMPTSSHSSSQVQFPQNFGGYHMPPT